jgi:hypothetical protein
MIWPHPKRIERFRIRFEDVPNAVRSILQGRRSQPMKKSPGGELTNSQEEDAGEQRQNQVEKETE